MLLLFERVCLFEKERNKTILYGQYLSEKFNKIDAKIEKEISVHHCKVKNDFYIEIEGKIEEIEEIVFYFKKETIVKKGIRLTFPFEECDLSLTPSSAIISTMCKDYSSRLEEWIEYNLNLGFSGIIIFDNDENKKNKLNEESKGLTYNGSTKEVCEKYKGKVWVVKMDYSSMGGNPWNKIQRITLHIGVNAMRKRCEKIALIDADEFIYIPNNKNINEFLSKYKGETITMKSNILTNMSNSEIIDNNILDICLYVGEKKYKKTILDTSKLEELEFILTPHEHKTQKLLERYEIVHYHCWVNSRYKFKGGMKKIEYLKEKKRRYKECKIEIK